jgi:ethanolamine utilization microcompartment shell protein EutS
MIMKQMIFESERGRGRKIFRPHAMIACCLLLAVGCEMTPPVASGDTGECTWAITGAAGNYTLTIGGDGDMGLYTIDSPAPWREYRDSIKRLVIRDGVTSVGNAAFYNSPGFTGTLTIPGSVTSIGAFAFSDCPGFTGTLIIPGSVTSIGAFAFSDCDGFTGSLIIPGSVTSIDNAAFSDCFGFSGTLTISNSVTSIGELAFSGCSGFTGALVIPGSVTSIGEFAFFDCAGLTSVTNLNPVPQEISGTVFHGVPVDAITLRVPAGAVDAYRAAEGWREFGNIVAMP